MFASQLPSSQAAFVSPIQYAYAYYNAVDKNGDGHRAAGRDPDQPGSAGLRRVRSEEPDGGGEPGRVRPEGADHARISRRLRQGAHAPALVSGTFTYRLMQDLPWTPLIGVTQANYSRTSTADRHGTRDRRVQRAAVCPEPVKPCRQAAAGVLRAPRDTTSAIWGSRPVRPSACRAGWMARVGFSTNDWREYFDDPSKAILDPTRAPAPSSAWPFAGRRCRAAPCCGRPRAAARAASSWWRRRTRSSPTGSTRRSGGVNISANLVTRQGYAEPYFQSNVATGDPLGRKTVLLVDSVDAYRLPAVTSLDGRVERNSSSASSRSRSISTSSMS